MWITSYEICIILCILRKPNSLITYYSFKIVPSLRTSYNMLTFVDVKFTSIVHEHQQERKFLGKIIYENLSWKPRITSICDKVAKIIGILSKSRRYLPSVTLKTLYYSFFLPYINYCNLMWASTYASYLEPLYLLQTKAIRIITFYPPRTRSKPPLFSKLNILSLHSHISRFLFCILTL